MRVRLALFLLLLAPPASASTFQPVYTGTLTNLSVSVATSAAQAIAASGTRKYLLMQDVGANNIYCSPFGAAVAGAAGTFTLIPNASLVFESSIIATNSWSCVAATGTTVLSVMAIQ